MREQIFVHDNELFRRICNSIAIQSTDIQFRESLNISFQKKYLSQRHYWRELNTRFTDLIDLTDRSITIMTDYSHP